jgi:predicted alpha/beta-hydrolase family hydrolase
VSERPLKVDVRGADSVSGLLTSSSEGSWVFVYAPGAGSSLADPFGEFAARALPGSSVSVLRFQFLYQEARKSRPDRNEVLEATWRAVIAQARGLAPGRKLVAGGRSMGGRIASQVVAAGENVEALALFAYPLHPPGSPERSRDGHLPAITIPTLFCSGTRDAFASPEDLRTAAASVPGSSVHLMEGADHGFAVPKSSGRRREDVWREACDSLVAFLRETDP